MIFVVYQLSLHGFKFNLNNTQNHKRMHINLIKNINFITNLIDVTLTTNHFHHTGINYSSQIMVLHHFILIIIINFLSYVY